MQTCEMGVLAEQMILINKLRLAEAGASVTLICDNDDFNGLPNCAIYICNSATDWCDKHFAADTLTDCLRMALDHFNASQEPSA